MMTGNDSRNLATSQIGGKHLEAFPEIGTFQKNL